MTLAEVLRFGYRIQHLLLYLANQVCKMRHLLRWWSVVVSLTVVEDTGKTMYLLRVCFVSFILDSCREYWWIEK